MCAAAAVSSVVSAGRFPQQSSEQVCVKQLILGVAFRFVVLSSLIVSCPHVQIAGEIVVGGEGVCNTFLGGHLQLSCKRVQKRNLVCRSGRTQSSSSIHPIQSNPVLQDTLSPSLPLTRLLHPRAPRQARPLPTPIPQRCWMSGTPQVCGS